MTQPGQQERTSKGRLSSVVGISMVAAGLLLLVAVGLYYGYGAYARSQLDALNFSVEPASEAVAVDAMTAPNLGGPNVSAQVRRPSSNTPPDVSALPARSQQSPSGNGNDETLAQSSAEGPRPAAFPASSYASIYPAALIHPKFWTQPIWAGGDPYRYSPDSGPALPDGFRAVSPVDAALPRVFTASATRITVPAIGVDSAVDELEIINLGDSRAYETPKNIVGHIPESPNPGELGNGWFFGHLESPIKGEGNVFQRLPEIPEKLRNGDDIYVTLENESGRTFLYKVSRTQVVHQDDIRLYDSDSATITLVACVPRLVYDHRILVTADLVGIGD